MAAIIAQGEGGLLAKIKGKQLSVYPAKYRLNSGCYRNLGK